MKTKVDPKNITNFNRTDGELEAFMVFSIAVAGKNANQTANLIAKLLKGAESDESPFQFLRRIPLDDHLRFWRVGQYRRILPALEGVMKLDLRTCTMGDLLKVHGIGPTYRYAESPNHDFKDATPPLEVHEAMDSIMGDIASLIYEEEGTREEGIQEAWV